MVKKRKNKKKQEVSDYGAQQLIRIDKKIIRLVDKAEYRLAFSKANGGRRIEKVNNSVPGVYGCFVQSFVPFR